MELFEPKKNFWPFAGMGTRPFVEMTGGVGSVVRELNRQPLLKSKAKKKRAATKSD